MHAGATSGMLAPSKEAIDARSPAPLGRRTGACTGLPGPYPGETCTRKVWSSYQDPPRPSRLGPSEQEGAGLMDRLSSHEPVRGRHLPSYEP
jgi:hypothetical protein